MKPAKEEKWKVHAVVLGAGMPLGDAVIQKLASESKEVTAVFVEGATSSTETPDSVERATVDSSSEESVAKACRRADIVYDCYYPSYGPMLKGWPEFTSNVVYAAIGEGALLVFASPLRNSEMDNAAMEAEVLRAHKANLTRTAVARIPQLIGRGVVNPLWKMIYDSVLAGKKAHWVGDPDVPRSVMDVEDAASALITLAGDPRSYGRAWNIANPVTMTGRRFVELAFRAVGREPDVGRWGRGIVLTGGPLASASWDVLKMPYDYYSPFVLDGSEFAEAFPSFRFTTPEESVSRGVVWYRERKLARG